MTLDTYKNLTMSIGKVNYEERSQHLNQKGLVVWFTGISGSGKSTISLEVERELANKGFFAYRLDGDNIRHGLCSDLGFSEEDRNENIRRVAEVAGLLRDVGIITLVSFISPYRSMRRFARQKAGKNNFIEIYVKAGLKECIERDAKGLYKKALNGEISDFTGLSAPYEEPVNPDLIIETSKITLSESAERVTNLILEIAKINKNQ